MNSPTALIAFLASGAVTLAQAPAPLRIAGLDELTIVWQQNTEDRDAIIEYDERPGERTLVFAHVTIDETVAGTLVAAGIINALPFLASPTKQQWQLTAAEFTALTNYHFTGNAPMVPPRRIAKHLVAYGESSNQNAYGSTNSLTTGFATHVTNPNMVGPVSAPEDERNAWAGASWAWDDRIINYSFDTVSIGSGAVIQSAYEYAAEFSLPPINQTAINGLTAMMDARLGFEIYVQAAHIKTASGGEVEVRISRSSRIRRLSLHQFEQWPLGPSRFVPQPTNDQINIYLAPRGDFLHIEFPVAVGTLANPTTLRAYVPTTNGLAIVDQVANPTSGGTVTKPYVGIFPCPSDTIDGLLYIVQVSNPGQRLAPLGHYGRAAVISAYDIPPGTIIPPSPPANVSGGGQGPR
jgi:hypothetical protein